LNFCPDCGRRLRQVQLDGVPRQRWHCADCDRSWYEHPTIMLTCFVSCGRKLLWIKRKFDPCAGFWAIPGGFMEQGESSAEGAARELWEEAGIRLQPEELAFYMTGTITFINQVYIAYRATLSTDRCAPGVEALDAAFFTREECPWDLVAYPEVNDSIRRAYDDLERGEFGVYQAEMSEDSYRLEEVSTAR
jgi:ADP-ribose pyrophosphatase YjhB (NUDIX family)